MLLAVILTIMGLICNLALEDCKYEMYNYQMARAKLSMQTGDTSHALRSVHKALAKDVIPRGMDLDFSLSLAINTHATTLAYNTSILLAKGGVPLTYFDQCRSFDWYAGFTQRFQEYQEYFVSNFDTTLRRRIIALREFDSTYTAEYHYKRKSKIDLPVDTMIRRATYIRDEFVDIVQQYGFPCDQNAGYRYHADSVGYWPVSILLHHMFQRGDESFRPHLSQMVCDGKLRPLEATVLKDIRGFTKNPTIAKEMKERYRRYWQ